MPTGREPADADLVGLKAQFFRLFSQSADRLPAIGPDGTLYEWPQSPDHIEEATRRVFDAIEAARVMTDADEQVQAWRDAQIQILEDNTPAKPSPCSSPKQNTTAVLQRCSLSVMTFSTAT